MTTREQMFKEKTISLQVGRSCVTSGAHLASLHFHVFEPKKAFESLKPLQSPIPAKLFGTPVPSFDFE